MYCYIVGHDLERVSSRSAPPLRLQHSPCRALSGGSRAVRTAHVGARRGVYLQQMDVSDGATRPVYAQGTAAYSAYPPRPLAAPAGVSAPAG